MTRPEREAQARLLIGAVLLLRPSAAAPVLGTSAAGRHPVLRLLGARQVVQGTVSIRGLRPRGRALGALVDSLHALSCLALARQRPQLCTPALRNAAVSTAFAAWAAAGAARSRHLQHPVTKP